MLLQDDQLDDEVKEIMLCATSASIDRKGNINVENKDIVNTEDYLDNLTKSSHNNLSKNVDYDNNIKNVNLISSNTGTQDSEFLNIIDTSCSKKQIACIYERDELVQAIIKAKIDSLQKLLGKILKKMKLSMGNLKVDREKLYIKDRLYITNNNKLKVYMLWQHHDSPEQGYLSYKSMFQSMQNRYFLSDMAKNCKRHAVNCGTYCRTRTYNV